ncbi:hypothetical protein L249_7245 [Ophiocordyceps polyrhachis-furcata BCC 54312]|uniref:Restriction of telomere capping protein 4 n=1 Tax=Ophiocordyceps polyrhachis-furcata BCC 54312 TaxID=1330021 RepID=A0A367L9Z7_9HYPO|nr:hypothetical protein L249_7245 [Ophiocordyceps polyrhachis-furcata BCC 54312]
MGRQVIDISHSDQPKPLLRGTSQRANATSNHKLSSIREVGVNDPPLSTDDEDYADNAGDEASNSSTSLKIKHHQRRSTSPNDQGLHSSSDEGGAEADMASTRFRGAQSGTRKRKASTKDKIDESKTKYSDDLPSAKTRRRGDDSPAGQEPTSSNPYVDELVFSLPKKSPKIKYGKQRPGGNKIKQAAAKSKNTEKASACKPRLERPPDDRSADLLNSPRRINGRITRLKSPVSSPPSPIGRLTLPSSINGILPDDSPTKNFKVPANFGDLSPGPGSSKPIDAIAFDLSSDLEERNSPSPVANKSAVSPDVAATVCPWCEQPVNKALLDEFSRGKRMNVRQQTIFCRDHKKKTARETWRIMKYPEVDWRGLDKRFEAHRSYLLGIVDGNASHYRKILASKIESGQARSMMKEGNMNPGYYGPRGFKVMCDYLVGEFGGLLKRKAVSDRVIAGRGAAAFIQCVLVAELAVRLIRDDMDVSAEDARGILEESKALGEILHDE